MKRFLPALALGLSLSLGLSAEVEFLGLDLGSEDILLFSARAGLPNGSSYDSLFAADADSGSIAQLTVYPEHVAFVDGGRRLQVQNRFGLFRTDTRLENLAPVPGYPAFVRGSPVPGSRLLPCSASPDGSWVLSAEPTSSAFSRIVLFDASSGASTTVAERVEYSADRFPARWSPDSRHFVYSKGGELFYYSVEQLQGDRVLGEQYRRVGEGRIASVRWGRDGSLYYLRGSSLYRILPAEFFTQALYRGLAGMGVLTGKTPFPYDENFDDFWVSADGARIILSKGGRSLFLIYLDPDDYGASAQVTAIPHLYLQGNTIIRSLLWPARGPVTVFTGTLIGSERTAGAYRFSAPVDAAELDLAPTVASLDVSGALEVVLSPDESKVAVVSAAGVLVRGYADWGLRTEIKASGALHALWIGESRLIVAGTNLIEAVDLAKGTRSLVGVAQAEAYGRGADGAIFAKAGGVPYRRSPPVFSVALSAAATGTVATSTSGQAGQITPRNPTPNAPGQSTPSTATKSAISEEAAAITRGAGGWAPTVGYKVGIPATNSERYRVYLDAISSGVYRNIVMIRAVQGLGTRSLFPKPPSAYAAFPDREEPRAGVVFDHGSRIRRREVALVFNALEAAEGLVRVLDVLKEYGIRATFFANGEFVRREPGASRLLSVSGHEVGSMFFSAADPTDARFRIDRDYVRRGLARAEDDWFTVTGKELSLLWHTPYYTVNEEILEAGASMNYTFIGRDLDPLDWVSKTDASSMPGSYIPSHDIVERVVAGVRPGSIIPIRLGVPEGGRADYLFNEVGILVDALRNSGYSIVPVSTLMEHAE